jgi:putative SOS response-associated peptidase YedK
MCSHYQAIKESERFRRHFGVEPPADLGKHDLWPGYVGSFIRRHPHDDVGDEAVPEREALNGLFGLVPHWSQDTKITRHTYNARSETVAEKPSFRDAWRKAQHCIIPAEAFFEPDWRSGKAVATRIARADGEPMGIAGLWSSWKSPKGELIYSYTMLTINADEHPLMRLFHKPTDEKRMVVVLPPERYQDWLEAPVSSSMAFMHPFSVDLDQTAQPTVKNTGLDL